MHPVRRRSWSGHERLEVGSRWKRGQGMTGIGRALSRPVPSVQHEVARAGGIAPARGRRAARVLELLEREGISRGLAVGMTIRGIARLLQRAASTVSREVRRHGGAGY